MNELVHCACAGINLDKLVQPTILALLAEGDLHGYGLIQKIVDSSMFAGQKPDPAGIYRFLKILENRGLVISKWDISPAGPPKKIYKITPDGLVCLEKWIETLEGYRASMDHLLKDARRTLKSFGVRRLA